MFLPSLNINVSSYAELFWHLLVNRPTPSGPIVETNKPPPTIPVPDKATKPFLALIIGINNYESIRKLQGAVKDATDMFNYVHDKLEVPESQICFLTDEKATRADIIRAFLDIQADTRIKKDDPILIFYAGHGDETKAPTGWPHGDADGLVQMIIPQDYNTTPGEKVHGIPDHTLAALLNGISKKHGENITVIFDCCNSGSGTRGPHQDRGLDPNQRQTIPATLDSDIWGAHSVRGSTAPGFSRRGLSNHVLLAACTQKETAKDGGPGGGAFTQALLPILQSTGADKLTYVSVLERIDKLPEQNPQREGVNQNHFIFDSKAPPTGRVCYPIQMNGTGYEMKAGAAHGITQGAEFSLYDDIRGIDDSTSVSVFVVASEKDISPFTTTLRIKQPSEVPTLSKTACVLQTKAGEAEDLLVFAPLDDKLVKLYEEIADIMKKSYPGGRQFRLVEDREKARLALSIVDDRIEFEILEPRLAGYYEGWRSTRMPYTVGNNPQEIITVLQAAAHFYWHLNREAKNNFVNKFIDIECNTLESTDDYDDQGNEILKPMGENHYQSGVIDIVAHNETSYGFKITNNSQRDLYINAFYFENNNFRIVSYAQSARGGKGKAYPNLPQKGGSLTIGYGSGGLASYTYTLDDNIDMDVGYLVFFISSEEVNLSTIPQDTPFKGPGRKSVPAPPHAKLIYGTRLVPIIQRRYPLIKE